MMAISARLGVILVSVILATGQWVPIKDVTTEMAQQQQQQLSITANEKNVESGSISVSFVEDAFLSMAGSCPPKTIAKRNGPVYVAFQLPRSKPGTQISFSGGRAYRHVIEDDTCYTLSWSDHFFECNEFTGTFRRLNGTWPIVANVPSNCESGRGFRLHYDQPYLHVANNLPLICSGKKIDIHYEPIHVRFDLPSGAATVSTVSFSGGSAGRRVGNGTCIETQWTNIEFLCDAVSVQWRVSSGFWNIRELLYCRDWEPGSAKTTNITQEYLHVVDTTDQPPCEGIEFRHENGPIQVVMQLPSNFSLGSSLTYQAGETYRWYKEKCYILQWTDHKYSCDVFSGKWHQQAGSFLIPDQIPLRCNSVVKGGHTVNGNQKYLKIVDLTQKNASTVPSNSTERQTVRPTFQPTLQPTGQPTVSPIFIKRPPETTEPSQQPTFIIPTSSPSAVETSLETTPTTEPTSAMTASPSKPTSNPTESFVIPATPKPSLKPTMPPSSEPSTKGPTTKQPTLPPTVVATAAIPATPRPTFAPPSFSPTQIPTALPSTAKPTPMPTPTPPPSASKPTPAPSPRPTTRRPTPAPSPRPTTRRPTAVPTLLPSTAKATTLPTPPPSTAKPTRLPTSPPSTAKPTPIPSPPPSRRPTPIPSPLPSRRPTPNPSPPPSRRPTPTPSRRPTPIPSLLPSRRPTPIPSPLPSRRPTPIPSPLPSRRPTPIPSPLPSRKPTLVPSPSPSMRPTPIPSPSPSPPTPIPSPSPSTRPIPIPSPLPSRTPTPIPSPHTSTERLTSRPPTMPPTTVSSAAIPATSNPTVGLTPVPTTLSPIFRPIPATPRPTPAPTTWLKESPTATESTQYQSTAAPITSQQNNLFWSTPPPAPFATISPSSLPSFGATTPNPPTPPINSPASKPPSPVPTTETSEPISPSSLPSFAATTPNPTTPTINSSTSKPPSRVPTTDTSEDTIIISESTTEPTVSATQSSTESTQFHCGCPLCTDSHWNRDAFGFSCGQRIEYIVEIGSGTLLEACRQVGGEFPSICGPFCDPDECFNLAAVNAEPDGSFPSQAPTPRATLILVTEVESPTPNLRPVPVSAAGKVMKSCFAAWSSLLSLLVVWRF